MELKLDGRQYSPRVLEKAITASAHAPSYEVGSKLLSVIGEIEIAGRQLNKLAVRIGSELTAARDAKTDAYFDQPLPRQATAPETPIPLASVSCDGGRAQTRRDGSAPGVHDPHWRETKCSVLLRAISPLFEEDPHPQLPTCFADRRQMKDLLAGLGEVAASSIETHNATNEVSNRSEDWRPEVLFRTCLSSLADSDSFGRMMAAEADSRGFYCAAKQAFVADGLPYNWTIQQRHFPTFTPIVDFLHVVEHLYDAARSVNASEEATWQTHIAWVEACWQGRVREVIAELRVHQTRIGLPPPDCDASDARQVVSSAIGYFEHNAGRMDYPRYRREGLPVTSSHMESYVKELNYRVKSTEKFWNDGSSCESMLSIRSASLCDDSRLPTHLSSRPGHPFHPNTKPAMLAHERN